MGAIIRGDPHVFFAGGGKADFRGRDGKFFCFLSTPTVTVNVMTEDGDFRLNGALVHGSWISQLHVVVQTSAGELLFSYWASKISPHSLLGWSNGTCAGSPFKLTGSRMGRLLRDDPMQRQLCGEVLLQANHSSVALSLPEWLITVAPMAVPDYYHRSDWIAGPKVRLDVAFHLRVDEKSLLVSPHGIVGQSFDGSGIAVDGAQDPPPRPGLELTTSAMAEGAIEGTWEDYVVASRFATAFRFSRRGLSMAPPRDISVLTGRKFALRAAASTRATASVDGSGDLASRRLSEDCTLPL